MDQTIPWMLASLFTAALAVVIGWIVPITYGVQTAIREHYSPHWMWFGIHPVGGWIAFAVLSCLPPRVHCPTCFGIISPQFRICPYCRTPMDITGPGQQFRPMMQSGSSFPGNMPSMTYPTPSQTGSPMVDDQPIYPAGPPAPR